MYIFGEIMQKNAYIDKGDVHHEQHGYIFSAFGKQTTSCYF